MRRKMLYRLTAIISKSLMKRKYVLEDVFWVPVTNCKGSHSTSHVHSKTYDTVEISSSRKSPRQESRASPD